jgi:hypothetical protein
MTNADTALICETPQEGSRQQIADRETPRMAFTIDKRGQHPFPVAVGLN